MVAQRTLTPYVRVRILLPLPKKKTGNVEFPVFFFLLSLIPQGKVVTVLPRNAFYP